MNFDALSDRYLDEASRLHPCVGTHQGDTKYQRLMTDYSPEGIEARAAHVRATLAELDTFEPAEHRDDLGATFLREVLEAELELHELGDVYRDLSTIEGPADQIQNCFEIMPQLSADDWDVIADRLDATAASIRSARAGLEEGRRRGLLASLRQIDGVIDQVAVWSGRIGGHGRFDEIVEQYRHSGVELGATFEARLHRAGDAGAQAYGEFHDYLVADYRPHAEPRAGVGAERYAAHAHLHLAGTIDLDDAYAWGWEELRRIARDRDETARAVLPGATLAEAKHHLEHGGGPVAENADAYRGWLQERTDQTMDWIDGRLADVPPQIRRCEVMLAPPGSSLAAFCTAPSTDFRVPGRTWWPTGSRTVFPLWDQLSTCYHEGVPGHHLQGGWTRVLGDRLSSFQRFSETGSALIEGWAMYAERMMDEHDRLDDAAYRLGFLCAQAMRATRVVIDIGMHLDRTIPADAWFHPGEQWTPELAAEFLEQESGLSQEEVASEITRYLSWPGQAICYKLGERAIMAGREQSRARRGAAFDLKAFNTATLDLGVVGVNQIEVETARL